MRFVLAGSSGFLGTALRDRLARNGHDVVRLVRGEASTPSESRWDPYAGLVDADLLASADVVVNLSGAPIAHWPWTRSYQKQVLESRLAATKTLARTIASTGATPALLSGSGIGIYGDRGDEPLDETSAPGNTFFAEVARRWEDATEPAAAAGSRVVILRTGVVLDAAGGALRLQQVPFRLGLGGRLGSGRQWFSPISRDDWVAAVTWLADHEQATGPHNLVAPAALTNAEFSAAMGKVLRRPSVVPVPAAPVRLVLGGLSDEILGSLRVLPTALADQGFSWEQPDITAILRRGFRR